MSKIEPLALENRQSPQHNPLQYSQHNSLQYSYMAPSSTIQMPFIMAGAGWVPIVTPTYTFLWPQ